MLFGLRDGLEKAADEPEFFVYIDYAGNTKAEIKAKKGVLNGTLKDAAKRASNSKCRCRSNARARKSRLR